MSSVGVLKDIKVNISADNTFYVEVRCGTKSHSFKQHTLRTNKIDVLKDVAKLLGLDVSVVPK